MEKGQQVFKEKLNVKANTYRKNFDGCTVSWKTLLTITMITVNANFGDRCWYGFNRIRAEHGKQMECAFVVDDEVQPEEKIFNFVLRFKKNCRNW